MDLAWLRQIHSNRCIEARPGAVEEGDALWTDRRGIALCIATADCVPVVIAGNGRLAVAHAGWRGIVSGVVASALEALGQSAEPVGWIGPSIGVCCYEVGDDVARRIADSSSADVIRAQAGRRPRADLAAAVEAQLTAGGVHDVRHLGGCTSCQTDLLWSYRREGPGGGRNLTFAWIG